MWGQEEYYNFKWGNNYKGGYCLKQRPIIIITISYIIGILWGIYLKINIYPFCIILFGLNNFIRFYSRAFINLKNKYINNLISEVYYKNILINTCIITLIISNIVINYKENRFENLYKNIDDIKGIGVIVNINKETEYYNNYTIKVKNINNNNKLENTHIILKIKKGNKTNQKNNYKYGDLIYFSGTNENIAIQRNYKGYDYSQYLKTQNIYGVCKTDNTNVKLIKENSLSVVNMWINNLRNKVKNNLKQLLPNETAGIATALLIGDSTRN